MYKKTVLDNGLKIIASPMPYRQSVALGIWINSGGRYENFQNKGIAHFLEHLLFKGTKKYSCRKIKEAIEGIGGALNAFTSEELTCYLVKMPAAYLSLAFDVLSDMVINPLLNAGEIEKEKTVVLEEIKMYRDHPQSYVYELLDELLWPNQPLGSPIIGSVETVSSINRDKLSNFRAAYYTPSNIVISAAGSLNYNKLIRQVKGSFHKLQLKEKNKFLPVKEEQKKPQLKIFSKDTEQTHLALGFHSFKREHKLKHALGMLHIVLGANMSSRLFEEVREKRGLAYEIGTSVKRYCDTGAFTVHAGIDNKKVPEAISLILKELDKTRKSPVTQSEFKRAREFYLGQLRLGLEDTMDYMLWIGESMASVNKAYTLEEIVRQVKEVTITDVRCVAREIFREDKLNLALIGPLKNKESYIFPKLKIG